MAEEKKEREQQLTLTNSVFGASLKAEQLININIRDISISLDFYDDIFSDFDPRPFAQREISKDFISELNVRHMENRKGQIEVRFFIPAIERDPKAEAIIKKRLREHFEFELKNIDDEVRHVQSRGALYIAVGFALLFIELVLRAIKIDSFLIETIGILLIPAGWYGMFTGIEKIVETEDLLRPKREMAHKFIRCNYMFFSQDKE